MISFYCSKCHHFIQSKHTPETEGQSIINESNLCESCTPRPSYIYPNEAKTHCKKGHPFDGIMDIKGGGSRRYCKTCQREADKRYIANHTNPHHRKSKGQTPPIKKKVE